MQFVFITILWFYELLLVFTRISAVLLIDISFADSYVLFMSTVEDYDVYVTSCSAEVGVASGELSISPEMYSCCDTRLMFFNAGCTYRPKPPLRRRSIIVLLLSSKTSTATSQYNRASVVTVRQRRV